ncbi:MAG: arylsulfatase [Thermoguttaceae bacterium]
MHRLIVLVFVGLALDPVLASAAEKPSLIYILADDLGYGDLGCYGQQRIKTPCLDRMAGEGLRFTDHYAGNTVCAPSRCSLMTGLHSGHTYVRGNKEVKPMGQLPLPQGTVTVARLLQQAGYRTALIGKWGLGGPGSTGHPNQQGFDHFFGYLCQRHAHNYYPEFLFRNDQHVPLSNKVPDPRDDGAGVAAERNDYSHDFFVAEAMQFIEDNKDRPFFLYLAMTLPHANNEAGQNGMEVPSLGDYADLDWPDAQKGHAAMISRMDGDVGLLLQRLAALGIEKNTLVLFASDNGPHREGGNDPDFNDSNGPLRGIKRDMYDGGIRVPLIARWPGRIEAGGTSDHVSAFWDFLPTACELAGIDAPKEIDGISYLPTLLARPGTQKQHDYLYWECQDLRALRMGTWKAVQRSPKDKVELYDLQADPGEADDVAQANPEIVAKVLAAFKEAHADNENFPFPYDK